LILLEKVCSTIFEKQHPTVMGPADASRWSLESDPEALLDHPSLQPDRIAGTNIFLSSAFTEGALEVLRKHGITHILQAS
jgi:hypothetical protein